MTIASFIKTLETIFLRLEPKRRVGFLVKRLV